MKLNYILKSLAVVYMTIEKVKSSSITYSIKSTRTLPPKKLPTTFSAFSHGNGETYTDILNIPTFNSTESDSDASTNSDNYISYVWKYNNYPFNDWGLSITYADKRAINCINIYTDYVLMNRLNYKLFCGNDCQYIPKFDVGTCKLVCGKNKNNTECLNDPNYYDMKLNVFKDLPQPKVTISTNEVMIIDSNESSTSVSNGDSRITIEKVISENEISYYNVESNDDRIYSCNNSKNLKKIFPQKTDFSRYCNSKKETLIFDLATCKVVCAPKENKSVNVTTNTVSEAIVSSTKSVFAKTSTKTISEAIVSSSKTLPSKTSTKTIPLKSFTKTIPTKTSTKTVPTKTSTKTIPTKTSTKTIPTKTSTKTIPTKTSTKTIPTKTSTKTIPTKTSTKTIPTKTSTKTIPTKTSTKTIPTKPSTKTISFTSCEPVTVTVTKKEIITEKDVTTITVFATQTSSFSDPSCAKKWEQCGGKNYHGKTCCQYGTSCIKVTDYYSQCA